MSITSRKPDWAKLAPVVGTQSFIPMSGPELPTYVDDLVFSDFSDLADSSRLRAIIVGLQQTCETLLSSRRRGAELATRLSRENDELKQEVDKLREAQYALVQKAQEEFYRCSECGKKFKTREYLEQHLQRRHNSPPIVETNQPHLTQRPSSQLTIDTTHHQDHHELFKDISKQQEIAMHHIEDVLEKVVGALEVQSRKQADFLPTINDRFADVKEYISHEIQEAVRRAVEINLHADLHSDLHSDETLTDSFLTPSP